MHVNWRDCQEWSRLGFTFSTTSNEAVKLYDASMAQWIGHYEEQSLGGFEKTINKLMEADANWVMSHVISNGLELLGTGHNPKLEPELQSKLDQMYSLAENPVVTDWERRHVAALKSYAEGELDQACDVWERILVENPFDVHALGCVYLMYIYLGYSVQLRDSITRILPSWNPSMPFYSYLLGKQAFGFNETNMFDKGLETGKKALELNPLDKWASHSVAHVYESIGEPTKGIEFLVDSEQYWSQPNGLVCHTYWHLALYHIEMGDYETALSLFDSEMITRAKSKKSVFDMTNTASLLTRLEFEGVNVGDRWGDVIQLATPHIDNHVSAFNTPHIMFSCLGAKDTANTEKLIQSIHTFIKEGSGTTHRITKDVVGTLCEALVAYGEGNYTTAVDMLCPIRYKIWQIGGSHAQRDVFNLFLIQSAIRSEKPEHQALARQLLFERKSLRKESPMADRLLSKAMAAHDS